MKLIKHKYVLASIFLSSGGITMNVDAGEAAIEAAIEWAPFVKAVSVTDEQLVAAANTVNSNFLVNQKGFIKRELIKKNESEYADVVYWQTKADAITAGEKVSTCIECNEYFKLMAVEVNTGGGFSHYTIIKSWSR